MLGRHDEVAFVFAVFIIDEHHHVATTNGSNHVVDWGKVACE
jgi:pSer/pThr/pTyr-binding forkhead associated (FHA) protein